MTQPTASIQLIVFGKRNENDFDNVLRDVASAGFPAFEAGNLFASIGESRARGLLAETGLRVSGAHFGYGDYASDDKLDKHIQYATSMGITNLMCSGVADSKSPDGYRRSAEVFNRVGARLKDAGLTFNYHNHDWEFADLGGTNGMEILSAETDAALVKFNIDVFWVHYAGHSPVEFIRQHRDRAGYFHFKDGVPVTNGGRREPEFRELGRGEVDLKACLAAAKEVGATWIVAEQDHSSLPAAEAARISREYLREIGV